MLRANEFLTDDDLGVRFVLVCRNGAGSRVQGYVALTSKVGESDESNREGYHGLYLGVSGRRPLARSPGWWIRSAFAPGWVEAALQGRGPHPPGDPTSGLGGRWQGPILVRADRRNPMGQEKRSADSTNTIEADRGPNLNEAAFEYYARLGRVREFVVSHLSEPILLRDAARIANYERTYFCAWFHRRAGVRFKEWLTLERLQRATELMRTEDRPIWEVAHTVGFRSLRAFERAFKQVTLISPRAFKAQVRPS